MNGLLRLMILGVVILGSAATRVEAAGLPVVISATVDYRHNTLTISGQNFGSYPSVPLDSLAFTAQSPSSGTQIVANFPSGKASSSFTPGTYFLMVTFKNQLPTIFGVDIGANGAVGPAGPHTVGSVRIMLGPGTANSVLAYMDYDLNAVGSGSFQDVGSVHGTLPYGFSYELDTNRASKASVEAARSLQC
jgi:hypothetical protein